MSKYVLGVISLAIVAASFHFCKWTGVAVAIVVLGWLWWDAIPAIVRKCILGAIALGFVFVSSITFGWVGVFGAVLVVFAWWSIWRIGSELAAAITYAIFKDGTEERSPQEYKVKRNHTIVLPLNCPECGLLMTHVVCPKCGNSYCELGNCPHCRQRVKAISCPSCGTVIRW